MKDFELVISGLRRINPEMTINGLTLGQMEQLLQQMADFDHQILELSQESHEVQGKQEKLAEEYRKLCKQARSKVKGDLGDDALELELIGVVRSSQIVRTRRGKKNPPANSSDANGSGS